MNTLEAYVFNTVDFHEQFCICQGTVLLSHRYVFKLFSMMTSIKSLKINSICKKSKKVQNFNAEKIKVGYENNNTAAIYFLNMQVSDNRAGFFLHNQEESFACNLKKQVRTCFGQHQLILSILLNKYGVFKVIF